MALLAGCYNPTIRAGAPCDTECPGGLVCIDNVCREPDYMPGVDASIADADDSVDAVDAAPGDGDGDGLLDNADNCRLVANADQHDEDSDQIGDVCDPCPHISGTTADADGDGVGDACDPQVMVAKQRIKFFDPFTSSLPAWSLPSGASRVGETLRMTGNSVTVFLDVANGESRIATGGTIVSVGGSLPHQLALGVGVNSERYHYGEFYDEGPGSGEVGVVKANNGTYTGLASASYSGVMPTGAWSVRLDQSVAAQRVVMQASLGGTNYSVSGNTSNAPALAASTTLRIYTSNIDMRFDYYIVIETLP
jgi:hypothetical protein